MAKKFERVGGGQFDVYKEKKTDWSGVIGGIVVIAFLLVAIF